LFVLSVAVAKRNGFGFVVPAGIAGMKRYTIIEPTKERFPNKHQNPNHQWLHRVPKSSLILL
jgi:hypothetical protein